MKAWKIHEPGNMDQFRLDEIPINGLPENHIRIATKAIGINPADLMQVMGTHQNPPPLPFSPGFEVAGEVITSYSPIYNEGDQVFASMDFGAYQEYVDVPVQNLQIMPEGISYKAAAAIPVSYGTAYLSLIHRGKLKSGETLLVLGATGNVGSRMVVLGGAIGAKTIATYSNLAEKEYLQSLGVMECINYKTENVVNRIKEITNDKGVEVIADLVGGDMFQVALDSVAWEGRILPIGAASGKIPTLTSIEMLIRNASLVGTDFAAYISKSPEVIEETFNSLFELKRQGLLSFPDPANTFPFEEADKVLKLMGTGELKGKTVLTLR